MADAIKQYLRAVQREYATGQATEHSYRAALQALIDSFGTDVHATNEPRRVRCGAPDIIVQKGGFPAGYIECKDIGVALNDVEKSDQLKRYFSAIDNLILTDYLEFRYFIHGEQQMHALLARPDAKGKLKLMEGVDVHLNQMFNIFLGAKIETVKTPTELAERMANMAKLICRAIVETFSLEKKEDSLHTQFDAFKKTLLHNIEIEAFADMYAQTICYGMFSARVMIPDAEAAKFTREHAAYDLPKTNPFLRDVFDYIAGTKLDDSIAWAVELLAELLRRTNMSLVLEGFGKDTGREDPVIHFYESFLAAYDPKMREARGVYYTPAPVVNYIVRSVDHILREDFNCADGLADSSKIKIAADPAKPDGKKKTQEVHKVQILDPACGTGTFLDHTIRHIHDALGANLGMWAGEKGYVATHLLPRLHGFELLMAPYAVAHLKLGLVLKETGYDFAKNERMNVYLTNTLEEASVSAAGLFGDILVKEARGASNIKTDVPVMVVMGNPPYSGVSLNTNDWTETLLKRKLPGENGAQSYYEIDGEPLGEKKVWLQDDYVKFIRFAQWRIERTGHGILAFICNHGYLDNPTFRGMRQSLMHTFDAIYITDLHGNAKKRETAPDGSKDENVFDIQQGVAIGIFVKSPKPKGETIIKHADVYGLRDMKNAWLLKHSVTSRALKKLTPNTPHYFFVPRNETHRTEYQKFHSIKDIFPVNVAGVVTARDRFVIDIDQDALTRRIREFRDSVFSNDQIRDKYFGWKAKGKYLPGDTRGWKLPDARQKVQADEKWEERCEQILYRPFDIRSIYYAEWMVDWSRPEVMRHMLAGENLGLYSCRQTVLATWQHVLATNGITDDCYVSNKTRERGYLFPLYLYPAAEAPRPGQNGTLGLVHEEAAAYGAGSNGRVPNIAPEFVKDISTRLKLAFVSDGSGDRKKTFGPEDIFHYIYAVFHSPTYRDRYAEFLKIDFPRVPLTSDIKRFRKLCALGRELTGLHLLEAVPTPTTTYPQPGDNEVEKPYYAPPQKRASQPAGRVYINKTQYFENIPEAVWDFHVGGYQVCHKWLKDRKSRTLSVDDIRHYQNITTALGETIRLMTAIDKAIATWPLV